VPQENTKALLRCSETAVVSSVAEYLWRDNATPHIPTELLDDWKNAVVLCVDEDHILEGIFREFSDVAFRWIAKRLNGIRDGTQAFWFGAINGHALSVASDVLTREQRKELINRLCKTTAVSELALSLVAGDLALYEHLLSREELGNVRLDPLRIDINVAVPELGEAWQSLAIAAMQKGFSEGDILSVTDAVGFGWSGSMSSMFAALTARFEKLFHHSDSYLRKIGAIGVGHFTKLRDAQLASEKRAAVRGDLC
jgi:hypothetical protein